MDKNRGPLYRRFVYNATLATAENGSHGMVRNPADTIKRYTPNGDTLTVWTLSGMLPVYVRLGSDTSPWLRVEQGMVLYGDLSNVSVRTGWAGWSANPSTQTVHAVFYASDGPLASFPSKRYGARRGMICTTLSAPAGESNALTLWGLIATQLGMVGGGPGAPSIGRNGGTLILKNLEASGGDTLWIRYDTAKLAGGAALTGFPLLPGESLTLQLEEPILGGSGPTFDALIVWGSAAAASFGVILTSCEYDSGSGEIPDDTQPPLG